MNKISLLLQKEQKVAHAGTSTSQFQSIAPVPILQEILLNSQIIQTNLTLSPNYLEIQQT